jgi:hypothetical protein
MGVGIETYRARIGTFVVQIKRRNGTESSKEKKTGDHIRFMGQMVMVLLEILGVDYQGNKIKLTRF